MIFLLSQICFLFVDRPGPLSLYIMDKSAPVCRGFYCQFILIIRRSFLGLENGNTAVPLENFIQILINYR